MASRLLLMRHGQTADNAAGRLAGSTDTALSEIGLRQADKAAAVLASLRPERCFCSPLRRAKQTAEAATGLLGLDIEIDPDLREFDFGQWECKTFAEIEAADPQAAAAWVRFDPDFAFPGGEQIGEFLARAARAADRLAAQPGETVLAVAHGGLLNAMLSHLLGLSSLPSQDCWRFDIQHVGVTAVDLFDGVGVLVGLNLGLEGSC